MEWKNEDIREREFGEDIGRQNLRPLSKEIVGKSKEWHKIECVAKSTEQRKYNYKSYNP